MAQGHDISDPAAKPVAVIDIGTNGIRMLLAEVGPDGKTVTLERTQRAVRLGQDTFVTGRLSSKTMSAAVDILKDFRRILDTYRVRQVRAVATSAVREAANADAFLDRIYMSCGLDVEVIEPPEESRLTVSAVRRALREIPSIKRHDALIADVGGGSVLLTVLHDGQIAASESYRLGAIRLLETLSASSEPPLRAAEMIRHHMAGIMGVIMTSLKLGRIEMFIAVGGDARFAAGRIGRKTPSADLRTITLKAFERLVAKCERCTAEELARRYALPYGDAETLVPALLVYQALVHATAARSLLVCEASMRDGLLMDVVRAASGQEDEELAAGVLRSARRIAEKYRCDLDHAEHVTDLAVQIFDTLEDEHGLPGRCRLLLRVAGLLHECGGFVSGRAHHKHSFYLIANAEIFGLRSGEPLLAALVARYHRRSGPKATHLEYMTLPRDKRMIVSKLAAILRVADALDRAHTRAVRQIRLQREPNELVICAHGPADLTLERQALSRKADLFEEVFGMKVRLEEAPSPAVRRKK